MRQFFLALIFLGACSSLCAQYEWRHRACLPAAPRWAQAAFAVGNKGYVVGGNILSSGATSEVWEYDATTDTWTQKNNFPITDVGPIAFVIDDTAYVCLGRDINNNYLNICYRYEQAGDSWTAMANFPGPARYTPMAFAIDGEGYVGCGDNGAPFNDFYQYDPPSNTWTQMASFPGVARQSGFGMAVNGLGYMGFGLGQNITVLTDSYVYNPNSDSWAPIAAFPGPATDGPGYFVLNDTLYVASGDYYNVVSYTDCWRYDVASNTWVQMAGFDCIAPGRITSQGFELYGHGYIQFGASANYSDAYNDMLEFGPPDTGFATVTQILGADTAYCAAFSRVLSTPDSCTLWSTGVIGPEITVNSAGAYWAFYDNGCGISLDTIRIAADNLQSTVTGTNSGCSSSNGTASAQVTSGAGSYRYQWNNADTTRAISGLSGGTYIVTITDAAGCFVVDSISITGGSSASVIISTPQTTICPGDTATICATPGFLYYNWSNGDTSTCIITTDAGNYYVTASNAPNCSATSNEVTITQRQPAPVTVSVSGDTLTCYPALAYQWYYGGNLLPGDTSNVLIAPQPGTYTVRILDTLGCYDYSSVVKAVAGIYNVDISSDIHIYPNPSTGSWQLAVSNESLGSKAQLFDVNGKLVFNTIIKNPVTLIETLLADGIYTLRIESGDSLGIKKLIKF